MRSALAILVVVAAALTPACARAGDCQDLGAAFTQVGPTLDLPRLTYSSERDLWLAGTTTLHHWDGCRLQVVPLPGRAAKMQITALWSNGPEDTWLAATAIGNDGRMIDDGVFRWDGRRWHELVIAGEHVPTRFALWGAGRELWLQGTSEWDKTPTPLLHADRQVAARVDFGLAQPPEGTLRLLGGSSPADVWIAETSGRERLYHFDGRRWGAVKLPEQTHPRGVIAVWGERSDALWMLRPQGPEAAELLRWDGRGFTAAPAPAGLTMLSGHAGRLFAASRDGAIHALDPGGAGWRKVFALRDGGQISTLQGELAVGHAGWRRPVLLRWERNAFQVKGGATERVTALSAAGAVWATTASRVEVGGSARGAVLRLEGGNWRRVAEARLSLLAIWAGGDEAWAGGEGGLILRCDRRGCRETPSGTDDAIVSLWPVGQRPWAGGRGGAILEWDGQAWRQRAPSRGWNLQALLGTRPDEVWAGGAGLRVAGMLRWSGRGWTRSPFQTFVVGDAISPRALAVDAGGVIWAVGERHNGESRSPSALRWNGHLWEDRGYWGFGGQPVTLNAVATGQGTVWIAGSGLWRLDAQNRWEAIEAPQREPIVALAVAGAEVWIATSEAALPTRVAVRPKAAAK